MADQKTNSDQEITTMVVKFQDCAAEILTSHDRCCETDGNTQLLLREYLDAYVVNSGEIDDEVAYEVNRLMDRPVREVLPQIMEGRDLIGDEVWITKDRCGDWFLVSESI